MMCPSSSLTGISRGRVRSSRPFGPSTFTVPGSTATFTAPGIGIGSLPMRDNSSFLNYATLLPDIAEHLAAEPLAHRRAAAHDSFGGAQNRDPEPTENPRYLRLARVDGEAGAADPLHTRDDPHAIGAGLEDDTHRLGGAVGFDLVAGDVALVLEHARDLELQPGRRHAHLRMASAVGVAHARQHVGDGIGDDPGRRLLGQVLGRGGGGGGGGHHQLDFVTPGMRPSAASWRKQMRHMPNLRRNARGRPQMRQRLWNRTLYLGWTRSLFQRSSEDFFAKPSYLYSSFIAS